MNQSGPSFIIVEEYNCPCYQPGDELNLTGKIISRNSAQPVCAELVKDLEEINDNVTSENELAVIELELNEVMFNCGGCDGLIRLEYRADAEKIDGQVPGPAVSQKAEKSPEDEYIEDTIAIERPKGAGKTAGTEDSRAAEETAQEEYIENTIEIEQPKAAGKTDSAYNIKKIKESPADAYLEDTMELDLPKTSAVPGKKEEKKEQERKIVNNIAKMLSRFSLFRTLSKIEIKELVLLLNLGQFDKDEDIIKKGEPGETLYIITSGKAEVVDDEEKNIAVLKKGEVFGEISLLSGSLTGATVRAVEPLKVLSLNSRNFNEVLHKYPVMQMYLAKLITDRLSGMNYERSAVLASVMGGTFPEISLQELLQAYHIREKTGILSVELKKVTASISFNKGKLISARCGEEKGTTAFYELLKFNDGKFSFVPGLSPDAMDSPELGHFMCLLMEGLGKADSK